jgi:hypothetical protein
MWTNADLFHMTVETARVTTGHYNLTRRAMLIAYILIMLIPGVPTSISTGQIFESEAARAMIVSNDKVSTNTFVRLHPVARLIDEILAPLPCTLSTIMRYFQEHQ